MPLMQNLLRDTLPIMNGINILAEALNDRLQSLPGKSCYFNNHTSTSMLQILKFLYNCVKVFA